MKERSATGMNKKKITVGIGVISVIIIVVIAVLFPTLTKKQQMVFVSGRLFVSTNQDVSEMVLREAEVSEYDSPYIGIIESADLSQNSIIQSEKAVYKEEVAAFIKNVSADNVTVDIVEYITDTNKERIKELKISEEDMPDGYYIFNSDEEVTIWKCNAETVYTFIDWNGDFTGAESPEEYTTTDIKEFQKYIETYDNGEPKMPFFFIIENGYIKQIIEKPFA